MCKIGLRSRFLRVFFLFFWKIDRRIFFIRKGFGPITYIIVEFLVKIEYLGSFFSTGIFESLLLIVCFWVISVLSRKVISLTFATHFILSGNIDLEQFYLRSDIFWGWLLMGLSLISSLKTKLWILWKTVL